MVRLHSFHKLGVKINEKYKTERISKNNNEREKSVNRLEKGVQVLAVPILINCLLTLCVYLADRYTKVKKLPYMTKQVIIGILFGGVSAFASSYGVKWLGAVVNVRDAAPLSAGLIFGAPAGIISGVTMVFVPSISTFYISQKLGNGMVLLAGDIIETQFKIPNYPLGAAMSLVLMIFIIISIAVMNRFGDSDKGGIII